MSTPIQPLTLLVFAIAGWIQREQQAAIVYLLEENKVLKARLRGRKLRLTDDERRRIVHFNVTEHPSAAWTAQQMVNAFPWDTAPRYLMRDRDQIYGGYFSRRVTGLGIKQVLTAPRSPWQSVLAQRLIIRSNS